MQIQTVGASRTMSTREIAELTGKQVGHVNRDAAAMLADLAGTDDPELDHVRAKGIAWVAGLWDSARK